MEQRSGRNWWKIGGIGCLSFFTLGVLLIVVAIAAMPTGIGGGNAGSGGSGSGNGGGEQQQSPNPAPEKVYPIGEQVTVGNVEWNVTDAFLTNQLVSGFNTTKQGRFVVVDFVFTNNRSEAVTLDPALHMILKDSKGREFETDTDSWEFVPTDQNLFLESVNPGVTAEGRAIYQIPDDAKGFKLRVDDVEFMEEKSALFDLSGIQQRTYSAPASASASASASAAPAQ